MRGAEDHSGTRRGRWFMQPTNDQEVAGRNEFPHTASQDSLESNGLLDGMSLAPTNTQMKRSFFARHAFTILVVAFFIGPFVLGGTRRALISNTNDVKQWLPASFKETAEFAWFRRHFENEQFVLISWEGCTMDDERLELLARKLAPAESEIDADTPRWFNSALTGPRLLNQLMSDPIRLTREQAIDRMQGLLIGPDGEQTCAVFALSPLGKEDPRATIEHIYQVAEQECALTPADIRMGGPPVDNVAIDVEGERTLFRLAGLSAIVGLAVSWWCLRSVKLTMIVFFVALYAAGVSLAMVWYTGERMNAVLLTMPSLVYVLTISGAIHLVNYYRDTALEKGVEGAADRSIKLGWVPCTLAAVSTSMGLGSLYISEIIPIQLFGLYSAIGVLATLPVLFFLLPAFLEMVPLPLPKSSSEPALAGVSPNAWNRFWGGLADRILKHHGWVTAGAVGLMILVAIGITRIQTSVKLMDLFSRDAQIVKDYAWLEEHLGPLVPMEVVVRIDPDKCQMTFLERMQLIQSIQQRVEAMEEVGTSWTTATFSPDLSQVKVPKRRTGGILGAIRKVVRLEDTERIEKEVRNKRLLDHRDEFLEEDFLAIDEETGEELWRISARVAALTDLDYGHFVADIKAEVEPLIDAQREAGFEGLETTYTGLVPLVYKAQHALLNGLINSFLMAFGLIAIVMMLVLQGFSAGLLSMIPNLFPATIIFGMMGWMGIVVDIGAMMTASVALGVAVDDTVHFMTWYRRGLLNGLNRLESTRAAYGHCAGAMFQTTCIAGLGMAMFSFSSFTPTQRFGYLMLTLLVAALAGDLLLLPAMLVGPLGKVFSWRLERRRAAEMARHEQSDENVDEGHIVPYPAPVERKAVVPETAAPQRSLGT